MEYFVEKESIVRKIWSKADVVLFIFAGSAAEFALNKAVDWLYFTGKIPSDPLNRLFSTLGYAQKIIFAEKNTALKAIDNIVAIHQNVEQSRGDVIPDWAYRDVLYMLIDYSIISFEVLERPLEIHEKEEVFRVFSLVGNRMNLKNLPQNYEDWQLDRQKHLKEDLIKSPYSSDLFQQYKKHLGSIRYLILLECQQLIIPPIVKKYLAFQHKNSPFLLLNLYKLSQKLKLETFIKSIILPPQYKNQIRAIENF